MLPTLSDFGISSPVYLRKINSRTHWHPQDCNTLAERAKAVSKKLFDNPKHIYSLWRVSTDREFYSVVASLSANRSPKNQDLDFIWITESELQKLDIEVRLSLEGDCFYVQNLHFNIVLDPSNAETLCFDLISQGREAQRCKRKPQTTPILTHLAQLGCKATETEQASCKCEDW
jgi:hypothetical protein